MMMIIMMMIMSFSKSGCYSSSLCTLVATICEGSSPSDSRMSRSCFFNTSLVVISQAWWM